MAKRGGAKRAQAQAIIAVELENKQLKKSLADTNASLARTDKAFAKLNKQMLKSQGANEKVGKATIRTGKIMNKVAAEVSKIRNAFLLWNFVMKPMLGVVQQSTKAYLEHEKAMEGLVSVGRKMGESQMILLGAVDRLSTDGLLKQTEAAGALRKILATGIGLPLSIKLMEAFKDAAAFGRQGML